MAARLGGEGFIAVRTQTHEPARAPCWMYWYSARLCWRARKGRYMPLGALPLVALGCLLVGPGTGLKPSQDGRLLFWALLARSATWATSAN
jgi:hypothetical protein